MVSCDTPEDNKKFAEQEQADFPLLSDPSRKTALDYGVVSSPTGYAKRWMFFIAPDGTLARIETTGHTADAGTFLVSALDELKVPKKKQ